MQRSTMNAIGRSLVIVVGGLGTGWMVGMSNSPIVASVVTSLLALLVTFVTMVSGVNKTQGSEKSIISRVTSALASNVTSPIPIMLLILAIAIGTIPGIWVRDHRILAPREAPSKVGWVLESDLNALVSKYEKHGLDAEYVAQKVLEVELGITSKEEEIQTPYRGSLLLPPGNDQ